MPSPDSPIGVFDSGLGGLTVATELFNLLPAEDVIYFGDVGRYPYGPRSKEIVTRFSRQDINFLIEQDVKMIVAACNTASAIALDRLQEEYDLPILGVIEPGAKSAVATTRNGIVGVIGTTGTINSNSYAKAIECLDPKVRVFSMACPLFVPLIEEGYLDRQASYLIAEDYLSPFRSNGIDTLVLGCTHYPLLKGIIRQVLGEDITLIDSAIETAREVKNHLTAAKQLNPAKKSGSHRFYVSDIPDQFAHTARHFLGEEIKNVMRIDIDKY
ncbi:MAG: glutamate racemase [candidate division Zixibacteria bacterium]|nr:glutamate racemase [candidate division Zixibacteria bacterium]